MTLSCKSAKLCKPLEVKLIDAYYSLKLYNFKEASLFLLDLIESYKPFTNDIFTKIAINSNTSVSSERLGILMGLSSFEQVQELLKNKQTPPERFLYFYAIYNQIISHSEIEDSILNLSPTLHKQLTDLAIDIKSYISAKINTSDRIVNINFSHFYYLLAIIYRILKQRTYARQYIKKSICLFPYNIEAIKLYSNLITDASELEEPVFTQMEPVFYSIMVAIIGLSLPRTEDTKEIVKHAIKEISEKLPSLEYNKVLKFKLYLKVLKNKKAINFLHKANLSQKTMFELSDIFACVLMKEKEEKKLQELVNKSLKYKKYDYRTLVSIGYLYKLKGVEEKSVSYLEKGLKLNPFNYNALIELSTFYIEQDRNNEAFECYIKAIELNPTDPTPLGLMARLYEFMGNIEMAVGYYWKAIELNPFAVEYWESISECLVKGRAYNDALKCLKRLEAFESSLFAIEKMVEVYNNQHDIENELLYRLKLRDMYSECNFGDIEKKTKNIYQIACLYFNKRDFTKCAQTIETILKDDNKFKNKAMELKERINRYNFESSIFDESGFIKKSI